MSTTEHTPLLDGAADAHTHETQTNLSKFRTAIGINIGSTEEADLESARKGAKGLYRQVIGIQRKRSIQYQVIDVFYYIALVAQILIGAILAALGVLAKLHPQSITILGVINASIGAILALLKGQGLPDRLRKDQFQMQKVQDFIEETDIRLALAGDSPLSNEQLQGLVQQVFDKYNTAIDTAEMNRPSSYAHQNDGASDCEGSVNGNGTNKSTAGQSKIAVDPGKGKSKLVID